MNIIPDRGSPLSGWVTDRVSLGRFVFTAEEAQRELGLSHGAFLDAAERLQRRHHLLRPRRGFYVVVPPQYLAWGAPPPSWYIDDLMRFEGCSYYVGLLKAAELHGATHQAVMEFQVVSDKRLPRIYIGRSIIAFYFRKEISVVLDEVLERKTAGGLIRLSSPELTAFELFRYPRAAGGLDHTLTVLSDIYGKLRADKLAALARLFKRSLTQRLGYLLDILGCGELSAELLRTLSGADVPWIELDPRETKYPQFALDPVERNAKWHVIVRHIPEADE